VEYMPQAETVGYELLRSEQNGSFNVSGRAEQLANTSIGQELEAKTGLDLSNLSNIQSVSKTDENGKIVLGMKSSDNKDVQLELTKLLPGLDIDASPGASLAIEQPKDGKITLDDFKGISVRMGGVTFDPTRVTIEKDKAGNPELQLSGQVKKWFVSLPAHATVELKNGKASVTDQGIL
ncbi:MAG TPA: hypothetical protein V6C72_19685, partial [Chroococcales cyanobacterium]